MRVGLQPAFLITIAWIGLVGAAAMRSGTGTNGDAIRPRRGLGHPAVGGEGSGAADTSRMARFPDHPNPSRILSLWADTHADNGVSVDHVRGEGVPEMGDWIGGRDGRAHVRWRDIRVMRRMVRARHNAVTRVRNRRTTSRSARLSRACPNRLDVPVMKSQATVRSTTRTASPPPPSTKARTCSTVRPRWVLRTPMGLPHHDDLLMRSRLRPTPGSRHAGITRPFQARFSQDKAAGTRQPVAAQAQLR